MKYAQLMTGLLIGFALGGSVVAATNQGGAVGTTDAEAIKKIIRETISDEPEIIVKSVQKYQEAEQKKSQQSAVDALKDKDVRKKVFNDEGIGSVGPKDSKRVIVEYFDYNCPACKMQYKALKEVIAKDPSVRVLFGEFPIFGPVSHANSHLGLAVARLYPDKYFPFYEKMMNHSGRVEEKDALGFVQELGLDVEKVKAEAAKPEVAKVIEGNREIGDKLHIQGTPTLVVGDEVIPHAADADELLSKLGK